MSIDLLVKLRDAHQQAADALNEELEKHAPPGVIEYEWNPENIKWVTAEGTKGPYERYPAHEQEAESSENYKNILKDLEAHKGKLTKDDYFYWLFSDGATVGRKKRKK